MTLSGKIRIDGRTKNLVKRIQPQEIAVIDHPDLDELAALSLVKAKVKAVINVQQSITGKYPNEGPMVLLKHKIPLIDNVGPAVLKLEDGQVIDIEGDKVYHHNKLLGQGTSQTRETILKALEYSKFNYKRNLENFVDNTLFHARLERSQILGDISIPALETKFVGRHTLIVVRGKTYLEDLRAVKSYIDDLKPVLIGVDGGADALWKAGYTPDIIFGDMDSVSDSVLCCGAELVVHAYPNGFAPGLERLNRLNLRAKPFAVPGTSEDAAMLMAYHGAAELIVAVGTHTNIIDFYEKGRSGMASTLLTRMKVGSILVDARGVSKLYGGNLRLKPLIQLVAAAMFPLLIIVVVSPLLSQLGRLLILKLKLLILSF